MAKHRPSKLPLDARAAEILAARGAVDPGELIDLIHEINPTGRDRGAAETAARYALKSRLQSLLVARFADDLEVTQDPNDPGVASLRHRYRRHDACHAVIAALDDDARSWVQHQLDIAAGPASEPVSESPPVSSEAPPADSESAAGLLAAGEEAQAAYDYERAGRCFSRAVDASGGSVAAAVACLAFMVDAMAADQDALALEGRLPAATLADPRVGLLLAVASARAGDEARALRHLGRSRDPRVAEVRALLARLALAAGDVERATQHVHAAEDADPAHPELRALADEIVAARAVQRAPREAQLAALLEAGREAEALAEAEAILARWPESEPARRAARRLEERRHEDAGRAHLAEGEAAFGRGEIAVALELLQRALRSPLPAPDRQRAIERVKEAEALLREKAMRAQVEQVVALLSEPDRARALADYVELEPGARAAVRARVAVPALGWLDLIPSARPGGGGRVRAAVEAVVALSRASALADRDLAAAAALIAPHERLLDEIPAFQSLHERARAAAAAERARRAAAELREAEEGLAAGRLDRAREGLDRIDPRALPEEDRARLAAFQAALALAEQRRREERHFDQLRAAGAFRKARAAARALAEREGDGERARWTAAEAAIAEHVRDVHGLRVEAISGGPELLYAPQLSRVTRGASAWVADGGRELCLVNTENAWLFLRFVDIETCRVTRVARLCADDRVIEATITVHAGGVTAIGSSGLFEIDVDAGEVVQRFDRNWSGDRGLAFGHGIHPEGSRVLWGGYGFDDEMVKIVDLDGGSAARTFNEVAGPWIVAGARPPRLITCRTWNDERGDHAYTLTAHEAGGAPLGRVEVRRKPDAVVAHPSGAGMVVLGSDYVGPKMSKITLLEVSERFETIATTVIEAGAVCWPQPQPQIAVALDAGLLFVVLMRLGEPHATLVAMRSAGPGVPLVEHYRVPVPFRTTVAHDSAARRAFLLVEHHGGLSITQLGPEPPVDLPESAPHHILAEPFQHVNWCGLLGGNEAFSVYLSLRKLPPDERFIGIGVRELAAKGDPHKMMELFHALLHGDWLEEAARILALAEVSFPMSQEVRLGPFAMLVARRAWSELLTRLDAGREHFEGPFLQHYHHLLSTAHARLGNVDEALRHLAQAESLPSSSGCSSRLTALREALESLPGSVEDLAHERPVGAQLVAVLFAADRCMEEGDPAGAVAVLDRTLTWDLHEVHSLGRLAAAYLALPASSVAARFRKALALASFVECMDDDRGGRRREGLAPGLAWPEERLRALRDQAVAWLEADQGTKRAAVWTRVR